MTMVNPENLYAHQTKDQLKEKLSLLVDSLEEAESGWWLEYYTKPTGEIEINIDPQ